MVRTYLFYFFSLLSTYSLNRIFIFFGYVIWLQKPPNYTEITENS